MKQHRYSKQNIIINIIIIIIIIIREVLYSASSRLPTQKCSRHSHDQHNGLAGKGEGDGVVELF